MFSCPILPPALSLTTFLTSFFLFLILFPGVQEYVEAVTFLFYLRDGKLPHWNDIQKNLIYDEGKLNLIPVEFFLGVGDLTGELMRCCIQSLGTGSTKSCYEVCYF